MAEDARVIADFNKAIARETEGKNLLDEVILQGITKLLGDPTLGFYMVAVDGSNIVGALMVTNEWSDWRNGNFWWIQSVYIKPDYRRQGIYRRLYQFIKKLAEDDRSVCGFRLYVEHENQKAQATYRNLGMTEMTYRMYEELRAGVSYLENP